MFESGNTMTVIVSKSYSKGCVSHLFIRAKAFYISVADQDA